MFTFGKQSNDSNCLYKTVQENVFDRRRFFCHKLSPCRPQHAAKPSPNNQFPSCCTLITSNLWTTNCNLSLTNEDSMEPNFTPFTCPCVTRTLHTKVNSHTSTRLAGINDRSLTTDLFACTYNNLFDLLMCAEISRIKPSMLMTMVWHMPGN